MKLLKRTLIATSIILPFSLIAGCSSEDANRRTAEGGTQVEEGFRLRSPDAREGPVAYSYECEDGSTLIARPGPKGEPLAVFYQDETYSLQFIEGVPGLRYAGEQVTFVSQGNEAVISIGNKTLECVEEPRRSLIETARLRGANFWATGTDPEWTLEIGELSTRLNLPAQERSYEFPTPPPEAGADTTVSVLNSEVDGTAIRIEYEGTICRLEEGSQSFPFATRIELNGTKLEGCGQSLID